MGGYDDAFAGGLVLGAALAACIVGTVYRIRKHGFDTNAKALLIVLFVHVAGIIFVMFSLRASDNLPHEQPPAAAPDVPEVPGDL